MDRRGSDHSLHLPLHVPQGGRAQLSGRFFDCLGGFERMVWASGLEDPGEKREKS